MSDQPEHNPEPQAAAPTQQTLDGAWFRRERERVAIGRRSLAARLGTTESRLNTLEWRRQPVPAEWMTVLRELEFRIPDGAAPQVAAAPEATPVVVAEVSGSAAAQETSKAAEPPVMVELPVAENPPVAVVESPPVAVVENPPVAVVESPPGAVVESPPGAVVESPPVAVAVSPPTVVPADAQSVVPTATPVIPAEATKVSPAVDFFHGRWLREMRHQQAIPLQFLLHKLVTTEAELYALERQNIRLPLRWIPRLLKLGILSMEQSKAAARLNVSSQLNGAWLRQQRALLRLTPEELGRYLRASAVDVRVVESRMWPLPSEWFPILTALLESRKTGKQKSSSPSSTSVPPEVASGQKPSSKEASGKQKPLAPPAKPEAKSGPVKPVVNRTAAEATPRPGANFAETIVEYRLQLGQHAGLPAVDVMAMIAQDLRLAQGKYALTYDALIAAMKTLLHR
jgi:hypothetical protein